jgi:hypothetical protein
MTAPVRPQGPALSAADAFHQFTQAPAPPPTAPAIAAEDTAPPLDQLHQEPPHPVPALHVLRLLTHDAADRAAALLAAARPEPAPVDGELHDVARLLTHPHHRPYLEEAADYFGLTTLQMRHLTLAHNHGGPAGVDAAAHRQPADPNDLAHAETAIQPLRPAPLAPLAREDNRLTDAAARIQLRLHAGRWYPFTDWHGTWRPAPGHSADPAAAYKAARRALRG